MTEFFQNQVFDQLENAQKALNAAIDDSNYMDAHAQAVAVAELVKVVALMTDETEEEATDE